MNYSLPPQSLDDVFKLQLKTPTGRNVLERFLPQLTSKRTLIEAYPIEIQNRLREVLEPGQPIGACFTTDGKVGQIHFDPRSSLGVLAPFLLHEMVHALDENLWRLAERSSVTRLVRDRAMLKAEVAAFTAQRRFIEELTGRDLAYQHFLEAEFPRARILNERLTETDLVELYGFKIAQ